MVIAWLGFESLPHRHLSRSFHGTYRSTVCCLHNFSTPATSNRLIQQPGCALDGRRIEVHVCALARVASASYVHSGIVLLGDDLYSTVKRLRAELRILRRADGGRGVGLPGWRGKAEALPRAIGHAVDSWGKDWRVRETSETYIGIRARHDRCPQCCAAGE